MRVTFHFIEMNTRMQVEHPVTEMVTGLDLVREQIRVAAGEALGYGQDAVAVKRARDRVPGQRRGPPAPSPPRRGASPTITRPGGIGVRVDSALYSGYSVPPHYDSLVAKLIVHGADRDECRMRLRRALEEYVIDGIETTLPLHLEITDEADFIDGAYDIHWLERFVGGRAPVEPVSSPEVLLQAYAMGVFPMGESRYDSRLHWIDPEYPRRLAAGFAAPIAGSLSADRAPRSLRGSRVDQRLRRGDARLRRSRGRGAGAPGSTTRFSRSMARSTAWIGRIASSAGARRSWWAASTASRSARRSSARACSAARPTPARWRWCTWWRACAPAGTASWTCSSLPRIWPGSAPSKWREPTTTGRSPEAIDGRGDFYSWPAGASGATALQSITQTS